MGRCICLPHIQRGSTHKLTQIPTGDWMLSHSHSESRIPVGTLSHTHHEAFFQVNTWSHQTVAPDSWHNYRRMKNPNFYKLLHPTSVTITKCLPLKWEQVVRAPDSPLHICWLKILSTAPWVQEGCAGYWILVIYWLLSQFFKIILSNFLIVFCRSELPILSLLKVETTIIKII